ncbi:MAG: Gldg family protein [Acutalibacteraceae bacterium]
MSLDNKDIISENTENTENKTEKQKKEKSRKKLSLKRFFTSRAAKRGWLSILMTVLFIAVVVVLNIVTNLLVDRFPALSADLTSNKVFEMQQETIDYIKGIDTDVTITVLAEENTLANSGNPYYLQAYKLFKQFAQYSDKIELKYVDPASSPTYLDNYSGMDKTASSNLVIIESGKSGTKKEQTQYKVLQASDLFKVETDSNTSSQYMSGSNVEQAVTTSILNVTSKDKVKVSLITGVGENEDYYSTLVKLLENNAYEVTKTSIVTQEIDSEAKIAVLFAPTVDLTKESVKKIENFLSNNGNYGKSLLYIPSSDQVETPNVDSLLENWGMKLSDGLVYETDYTRVLQSGYFYFITDYSENYVNGLKNPTVPVVTAFPRAITITDTDKAAPLLTTSEQAGIMPFGTGEDFKPEDGLKNEVLNVAAVAKTSSETTSSHLVVFGSDFMVSDSVFASTSFNNSAYTINLFNTLAERDDLGITIEGKTVENKELGLTSINDPFVVIISIFLRFILPLGILIAGLCVWLVRRNK